MMRSSQLNTALILVGMTFFMLLAGSSVHAATISSCSVINTQGTSTLNQTINSTSDCLTINVSNTVIDCAGFAINFSQGGGVGAGIVSNSFNNLTVMNCSIVNPTTVTSVVGINITNGTTMLFNNNTIIMNGASAFSFQLSGVTNISIGFSVLKGTTGASAHAINIIAPASNNISIYENLILMSAASANLQGISWAGAKKTQVINNLINITTTSSTSEGILFSGDSSNSIIKNNTIEIMKGTSGNEGIDVGAASTSNLVITSNTIRTAGTSTDDGIHVTSTTAANITNNIIYVNASSTGGDGIEMATSSHIVTGNYVSVLGSSNAYCFRISSGTASSIRNNVLWTRGGGGGYLFAVNQPVDNNTIINYDQTHTWLDFTALNLNITMSNSTFQGNSSVFYPQKLFFYNTSGLDFNSFLFSRNNLTVNPPNNDRYAFLNTTARVILTDVPWVTPQALVNLNDGAGYVVCPANICSGSTFVGTTFSFNVTHFTNYSSQENVATPVILPSISLISPADKANATQSWYNFTWTDVFNATNATCNLTVDNVVKNSTVTTNNTPTNYTFSSIADGLHYWNVTCYDATLNKNTSATRLFVVDTTAPFLDNQTQNPISNTTGFGALQNYNFTINATDTLNGIDTVFLLWNGTKYVATAFGSRFNVSFTALPNGQYFYNWTANDTLGNTNTTRTVNYTVGQRTSLVNLTLDGVAANESVPSGEIVNSTATLLIGQGSMDVFLNGVMINSGSGPLQNLTTFTTLGLNNYTVVYNNTQNFSTSRVSYFVTITAGPFENDTLISPQYGTNATQTWYNFTWFAVGRTTNYLCNLTIDGVVNATGIAAVNNTPVNQTVKGFGDLHHSWNVTCSESGALLCNIIFLCNTNTSTTYTFTVDTKAPVLNNKTECPISPATFNASQSYVFVANLTDSLNSVSTVKLNFNGTTLTPTQNVTLYNASRYGLGIGTYSYNWTFNDSLGNVNTSANTNYVVSAGSSLLNMSLSPSSNVAYGITTTETCTELVGDSVTIQVFKDGSLFSSGLSPRSNVSLLAVGTYNFTCVYNTTTNYTTSSSTAILVITQASSVLNLTLNGSQSNITVQYGTTVNLTATLYNGSGIIELFLNGTKQQQGSSPLSNLTSVLLTPGLYNVTTRYNSTQNFTGSITTYFILMLQANNSLALYLNGSQANFTTLTNGTVTLNVTSLSGIGTVELFRNGTKINSGNTPLFNSSVFNIGLYNITARYNTTQNYSGGFVTYWVTSAPPPPSTISVTLSNGIMTILFNMNLTHATYAKVYNASGFFINITNITSYNNQAVNQTSVKGLFNVTNTGSLPVNITINLTGLPTGGPAVLNCSNTSTYVYSVTLNATLKSLGGYAVGTNYIWCHMDFVNATSPYRNYGIKVRSN